MRKNLTLVVMSSALLLTTSCASIVSRSSYNVPINSMPSEAKISITDKKGIEIYTGYTPTTIKLKSGSGFFGKARYQVKFEKEGYEPKISYIDFKLNGWYFGNLLFGGLIGMLIVDPATGAMYKIENEFLNETLIKKENISKNTSELRIININDIPSELKDKLVKL